MWPLDVTYGMRNLDLWKGSQTPCCVCGRYKTLMLAFFRWFQWVFFKFGWMSHCSKLNLWYYVQHSHHDFDVWDVSPQSFQSLHMLVYIIGSLCVQKTWMTSCNSASSAPSRDEWARVTFPCWPRPFSKVTCSHSGEYCTWEPWGRDLLLDWFSKKLI